MEVQFLSNYFICRKLLIIIFSVKNDSGDEAVGGMQQRTSGQVVEATDVKGW